MIKQISNRCFRKKINNPPETIFVLEFDSDDESISEYDNIEEWYGMQVINLSLPGPMIEVKIFLGKYERPITVAGLFDIEAVCSILESSFY